jgi:hypothetical protein
MRNAFIRLAFIGRVAAPSRIVGTTPIADKA